MSNREQKTFYAERVFVIYEPNDYRKYFRKLVTPVPVTSRTAPAQSLSAKTALEAWATVLVYRSRLLLFDFRKHLYSLFEGEGQFRDDRLPINPLASEAERQDFTMQLAIEAVTRRSDVRARIEREPYDARLIYDALYYPSFLHEAVTVEQLQRIEATAEPEFVISPKTLENYLLAISPPDDGDEKQKADVEAEKLSVDSKTVSEARRKLAIEPDLLFRYVADYLTLLSNPERIREETTRYARGLFDDESRRIWAALAEGVEILPIISKLDATDNKLRFRFDSDRDALRKRSPVSGAVELISALEEWRREIEALFGDVDAAWGLAARARLAPSSPNWSEIATLAADAERSGLVVRVGEELRAARHEAETGKADAGESEAAGVDADRGNPSRVEREGVASPATRPEAETGKADAGRRETDGAEGDTGDPARVERDRVASRARMMVKQLRQASTTLHRALFLAVRASVAAREEDPQERRLTALKAVANLFEMDIEEPWDQRARHFDDLLSATPPESVLPSDQLQFNPKVASALATSGDARALREWTDELKGYHTYASRVEYRETLNELFWAQWDTPKEADGRLVRANTQNEQTSSRNGGAVSSKPQSGVESPTIVDLLHATDHQGVPVVLISGARLSIAEWSRIRLFGETPAEKVPPDHTKRAEIELLAPAQSGAGISLGVRLAVEVWPESAQSFACNWLPEPGVFAFVVPPEDMIWPANEGSADALFGKLREECRKENRHYWLGVDAIEAAIKDRVRKSSARRLVFGPAGLSAPSLGGLLATARERNPELFATLSIWRRFWRIFTGR